MQALDELGFTILTPSAEAERGGSVMVRLPENLPAQDVLAKLKTNGLLADARGQILRLSPGVMSTLAATEQLIIEMKLLR